MPLNLISAGAAQGLVQQLATFTVTGTFGAVGAMLEKFRQGEPCDLLILTRAQLDALEAAGEVRAGSVRDIGCVQTGVAVRSGAALPAVNDSDALRAAFAAADAIYVPDLQRSTAGQHIAKVLQSLGLTEQLAGRIRMHPNGATAMRAMAAGRDAHPLGCTQVTEILYTPGVQLVGALPRAHALSTLYSVAVPVRSADAQAADALAQRLVGEAGRMAREAGGFVVAEA